MSSLPDPAPRLAPISYLEYERIKRLAPAQFVATIRAMLPAPKPKPRLTVVK